MKLLVFTDDNQFLSLFIACRKTRLLKGMSGAGGSLCEVWLMLSSTYNSSPSCRALGLQVEH